MRFARLFPKYAGKVFAIAGEIGNILRSDVLSKRIS